MPESDVKSIEGLDYRTGDPVRIEIGNGVIRGIESANQVASLPWIAPGLVDLQVNGFGGVDFNTLPLSTESVFNVTQMLWREGVTAYLPTVITNSDDGIQEALRAIARALRQYHVLSRVIPGIHLEGPFISPQDGPRGAHHQSYVKAPDWELFQRWQDAAEGHILLVTLSPEWPNVIDFIEKCVRIGVKVAIGHTAASTDQINAAVRAGASVSTHLGNGSHPVLPRHPNYIWDQLANDDLWACMIGDGFHLPDSVLKVIARVKCERAILVSDVVDFGGLEPGEYHTHIGGDVVLTPEGKLHLKDQPKLLAGSVQSLRQGVWNLVAKQLCGLPQAWEMASVRPSTYMGLNTQQGLRVDAPADIVLFEQTSEGIQINRTIKQGFEVYKNTVQLLGGEARG